MPRAASAVECSPLELQAEKAALEKRLAEEDKSQGGGCQDTLCQVSSVSVTDATHAIALL